MNAQQENLDRQTARNLAVDALRICAMIMVTILHITGHGLENAKIIPLSGTYWIVLIIRVFSSVAVNCFVLITGYFLSMQNIKFRKLIMLWLQVWMYSAGIYLLLCMIPTTGVMFSTKELIRNGLPLLSNQYWFFKYYFLLYLISPVLNTLIQAVDKIKYQKILILLLIVFCVIPSVNIFGDSFGANEGYSLIWFAVLYLVAGYFRRYSINLRVGPIWLYVASCLTLCFICLIGDIMGSLVRVMANLQRNYNSPLVFLASVSLVLLCTSSNWHFGKIANMLVKTLSPLVFGVYLLHDHGVMAGLIWEKWAKLSGAAASPLGFAMRAAYVLFVLFICGITVEWLRSNLLKSIANLMNRISAR